MTNFLKIAKSTIKNWYLLTVSGILFIGLGILVLFTPEESYQVLSVLFSVSFIISGITEVVYAISNREEVKGWGWNLASGILSFILGLGLVVHPEVSITILPFFVAAMVMYRSIIAIVMAFELKDYRIMSWGNLLAFGIIGLMLSFMLFVHPVFTGISLVVLTGMALIVTGLYSVYYSIKLKKINNKLKNLGGEVMSRLKNAYHKLDEINKEIKDLSVS